MDEVLSGQLSERFGIFFGQKVNYYIDRKGNPHVTADVTKTGHSD